MLTIQTTKSSLSLSFAIFLHLIPGALIFILFLLLQQLFPHIASALNFLFATILIRPLMWVYLYYKGLQKNKKFSLKGIILFREKMPVWQYVVFFIGGIAGAFGILFTVGSLSPFFMQHVFWWVPHQVFPGDLVDQSIKNHSLILFTLLFNLVVDGFVTPITEEAYYRGYLLPRMQYLKLWAPLMNALFFTLQHFWQPQNYLLIFSLQLIVVYLVWWKKNIYISMLLHCGANTIGGILALISFLG